MTDQSAAPRAHDHARDIDTRDIPVIDLHRLRHGMRRDRQIVAAEVAAACRTVGFSTSPAMACRRG